MTTKGKIGIYYQHLMLGMVYGMYKGVVNNTWTFARITIDHSYHLLTCSRGCVLL